MSVNAVRKVAAAVVLSAASLCGILTVAAGSGAAASAGAPGVHRSVPRAAVAAAAPTPQDTTDSNGTGWD